MRCRQGIVLAWVLLSAARAAAAAPPQIVYLHAQQTASFSWEGYLSYTCLTGKAAQPGGRDQFHEFVGEILVTKNVRGVANKPMSLDDAVNRTKELRVSGTVSFGQLRFRVSKPDPRIQYEVEVRSPTLAVPGRHALGKDELEKLKKQFVDFRPALAEIDEIRSLVRKTFQHSKLAGAAFDEQMQLLFWSGPKQEFPGAIEPKVLSTWIKYAMQRTFLVPRKPGASYVISSLLAAEPLQPEQHEFLVKYVGKESIAGLDKWKKAAPQLAALGRLPHARLENIRPVLKDRSNDIEADPAIFRDLYEQIAEQWHRSQLAAAKRWIKPGDVWLTVWDGFALLSTSETTEQSTRIAIPTTADTVKVFERDFKRGGAHIIGMDTETLTAKVNGETAKGEKFRPGDVAYGYLQMIGRLVKSLPPAKANQPTNVLLWTIPRLRSNDFAMLHALLRVANVKGVDRPLHWLDVADGSTRR